MITLPNYELYWEKIYLFYLLSVLNSKLMTFYYINKGYIRNLNTGTPQIRLDDLRNMPLVIPSIEIQKKIVKIIENLFTKKRAKKDVN